MADPSEISSNGEIPWESFVLQRILCAEGATSLPEGLFGTSTIKSIWVAGGPLISNLDYIPNPAFVPQKNPEPAPASPK